MRFGLSGLPRIAQVPQTDLRVFRGAEATGASAAALADIEIRPVRQGGRDGKARRPPAFLPADPLTAP